LIGYVNKKTWFSTAHNVGSAAGTHLAPAGVALLAGGGNRTGRALPPGNAVQGHLATPHTAYPTVDHVHAAGTGGSRRIANGERGEHHPRSVHGESGGRGYVALWTGVRWLWA